MLYLIFKILIMSLAFSMSDRYTITSLTTQAVDSKSGRLIYTEERKQTDLPDRPGRWYFNYKDTNGKTIVRRQVNFENNILKPNFRLDDLRDGYSEGAELNGDSIKVFSGGSVKEPYTEQWLKVPEPAVIDAGFNFLIEQSWDRLLQGKTIVFYFVAPSQLDYFKLRVYKAGETTIQNRPAVILHMDIDNFFLRLFVDAIRLTYDTATGKLVVYEGISNIYDEKGKSHKVRMEFNY